MSEPSYGFDPRIQRKAKDYLYSGLQASLYKGTVLVVLGFLVLGLRLPVALEDALQTYVPGQSLTVVLFALIGHIAFWFVSLPFDYYKGYVLEHRFELSTETSRGWFLDNAKASGLSLLVVLVFVYGVYNLHVAQSHVLVVFHLACFGLLHCCFHVCRAGADNATLLQVSEAGRRRVAE